MLYPLSYEGLRPTSYLAGDTHECPGVPSGGPLVPFGLPVGVPLLVGGRAEQIARTRGPACPAVTAGAQR